MPPEKRPHLMMLAMIDTSLVGRVDPVRCGRVVSRGPVCFWQCSEVLGTGI